MKERCPRCRAGSCGCLCACGDRGQHRHCCVCQSCWIDDKVLVDGLETTVLVDPELSQIQGE